MGGKETEKENVEPLRGIYFEQIATAMEAAAKGLGLPFKKVEAETELYIGGGRSVGRVPAGKVWVNVEGRESRDYANLWKKVHEMMREVKLSVVSE